jgi:hypothetical protein
MFWLDAPDEVHDVLPQAARSPDQAWALRRHPLVYSAP